LLLATNQKRRIDPLDIRVQRMLRFDHFYARRLKDAEMADKTRELSFTEMRIFHELGQLPRTPGWLSCRLNLDAGYVTRTLKTMEACRYLTIDLWQHDRRQRVVTLTRFGCDVYRELRSFREGLARNTLEELPQRQQRKLIRAMTVIEEVLTRDSLANLLERSAEAQLTDAGSASARAS